MKEKTMRAPLTQEEQEMLRQRFNPEGSPIRRQQLRMLEMLLHIDEICRRHEIRYWLSSGTLIGAVRHNGFIPWDDDLDIEMMRRDYKRLLAVLPKELPDTMAVQTIDSDPGYFFCYAKVRDLRSFLAETNDYDRRCKYRGVYIDIFPMEQQRMAVHKWSETAHGHVYKMWRTSKDDDKQLRRIRLLTHFNLNIIHPILRTVNRLTGAHIITSGLGVPFHNRRYKEDIFPLTTHEFEGHLLPVPHNADHMLRLMYGDYMQLPDIEKITQHASEMRIDE